MNSIIIDDEEKSILVLKTLLTEFCPQVNIIETAKNISEAEEKIVKLKPDLIFLDIEMPNGNAFDLLNKIHPFDFEIIFITAFENYAIKAFKYCALDYLLKPVSIEELKQAINKVKNNKDNKSNNEQIKQLLNNLNGSKNVFQKIAINTVDGLEFINIIDILRVEANGSYCRFYFMDGSNIMASKNIKEYEDILVKNNFFRIHNSHLINLDTIKKYTKGRGGFVTLKDGTKIEVAARRKLDFLAKL